MSNLSDTFSRTQALMKEIQERTRTGYAACFLVIIGFGWFIYTLPSPLERVGSGLTLASALYVVYQLHQRRNRKVPSEIQSSACAAFYRTELERQRDFHRGSWFWSRLIVMIPGDLLFLIGFAMAHPGSERGMAVIAAFFLGLCVVAVPLNLRLSANISVKSMKLDPQAKQWQ